MKKTKLKYNYNNIKRSLLAYIQDGFDLYYSVYFYIGKQWKIRINRLPYSQIDSLANHVKLDMPQSVRLEVFDGKDAENPHWVYEYEVRNDESALSNSAAESFKSTFNGFGEAEINNIVDQRLRERQQIEEFNSLKKQVTELTKELEEQSQQVEQLEDENERLQLELESKSQIRYYAGMLGDVLEGIGISKDKIRNPIATLMGISDNEKPTETNTNKQDTSGIVEDDDETEPENPEVKKRAEVISLMTDYLQSTDNQTLANLFTIFSDIESNPAVAIDVMNFLHSKN